MVGGVVLEDDGSELVAQSGDEAALEVALKRRGGHMLLLSMT